MKCMECTKKKAQHCICASNSAFIPVMHWSAQVHKCTTVQVHNCTARGGKVCNWVCKQSLFTTEYGVDREKETTKIFFQDFGILAQSSTLLCMKGVSTQDARCPTDFAICLFSCFWNAVFNLSFCFLRCSFYAKDQLMPFCNWNTARWAVANHVGSKCFLQRIFS